MSTRKIITKRIVNDSSTYIGKTGELFYDTSTLSVKISNGITAGGVALGRVLTDTTSATTAIDLTKQLALLEDSNSTGEAKNYTLANGVESQILYFAYKQYTSGGGIPKIVDITVTIANARIPAYSRSNSQPADTIQTNYVWTPFNLSGGNNGIGGAAFAIFTNGAWVVSHCP